MNLSLNIGQCCLLGNFRENNEDAIAVRHLEDATVCLVADGMGGHQAGEVASRRAIDVVSRELRKKLSGAADSAQTQQAIRQAVVQANNEILVLGALDRDLKHMGTTIVLGVWRNNRELHVAHVGDSRAYLVRQRQLEQLTVDHNLLQALRDAGVISPEEAERFSTQRNYLMRYLGSSDPGTQGPDLRVMTVEPGDRYLLCTDGLTGVVPDGNVLHCVAQAQAVQQCAEALGRLALEAGSRDNVSCIVVEVVRGSTR